MKRIQPFLIVTLCLLLLFGCKPEEDKKEQDPIFNDDKQEAIQKADWLGTISASYVDDYAFPHLISASHWLALRYATCKTQLGGSPVALVRI